MPDHLEAAIQAGADALSACFERLPEPIQDAEVAITAALPHLRRAIIQELAEEYDREAVTYGDGLNYPQAGEWLRAKLKEAES